MAIDADGAPNAYHPDKTQRAALDFLGNAGHDGDWWGVATDTGRKDGTPVVQNASDPYPGYYVSTTALGDPQYRRTDPKRYVNSDAIPYLAVPKEVLTLGVHLGDLAVVLSQKTGACSGALVADIGPPRKIGEGSIALARRLGVPSSPKNGGASRGLVYLIFPNSGNRKPRGVAEIDAEATRLLIEWGGETELRRHAL